MAGFRGHLGLDMHTACERAIGRHLQDKINEAIAKDRKQHTDEVIASKTFDEYFVKRNKEMEAEHRAKMLESANLTINLLKSAMWSAAILGCGLLPGQWKVLQIVPVAAVVWLNRKVVHIAFNTRKMKFELEKEVKEKDGNIEKI
jgi:hypothetical protein